MSSSLESIIAVNRFGLGARPSELDASKLDPRAWLIHQVQGSREAPDAIAKLPSSATIFKAFIDAQDKRREAKLERAAAGSEAARAAKALQGVRQILLPMYLEQVAARYQVACTSDEPLRERLTHFWSNHFAVSADKLAVVGLAGALENEAIRPNLNNHFYDMLLQVEMHPAMILYLDNQASVGSNSLLAKRAERLQRNARKIGINENLAREILELHTLGVDGGYTQTDVTIFAQALTGWSVGGGRGRLAQGEPGRFVFREMAHEPGAKNILGKRYASEGIEQPKAVLKTLAQHPATAKHIATKLVRHFVGDEPPRAAVEKIAKVFRDTEGHLPSVHLAVVELAQAWQEPFVKFKTPHEFVISTFRALNFVPPQPQQVVAPFQLLGQRPFTPGSPAGWPDTANQWDGSDALMKRIEWSTALGQRMGGKVSPLELADKILSGVLGDHTRTAISRASSSAQALTLLLMSPEFQRR